MKLFIFSTFPKVVSLQHNPYNLLEHEETIEILNVTIHAEFNSLYYYNNIALVHLNGSVSMTNNGIYPACIPEFDIEELKQPHQQTGLKENNCPSTLASKGCNTKGADKQQGNE